MKSMGQGGAIGIALVLLLQRPPLLTLPRVPPGSKSSGITLLMFPLLLSDLDSGESLYHPAPTAKASPLFSATR